MTKFCKVYMNSVDAENELCLDEGRRIGLYAWGRVTRVSEDGKVTLLPTSYVFEDVGDTHTLVRERKDVTWLGDPIVRKRYINEIKEDETV